MFVLFQSANRFIAVRLNLQGLFLAIVLTCVVIWLVARAFVGAPTDQTLTPTLIGYGAIILAAFYAASRRTTLDFNKSNNTVKIKESAPFRMPQTETYAFEPEAELSLLTKRVRHDTGKHKTSYKVYMQGPDLPKMEIGSEVSIRGFLKRSVDRFHVWHKTAA